MSQASHWSLKFDVDNIAWLTCDMAEATTNVLSAAVIADLAAKLEEIRAHAPKGVVLQSAKPNGFIAGADIKEFQSIKTPEEGFALVRQGQAVIQQIEDLPCPSVALLHGFALGGGLELALACSYRVAADDKTLSLGLPEVQLGIHPGFGGTVRSVRIIGVRNALELMLKGRPFRAARALSCGLIDELAPRESLGVRALAMLRRKPAKRHAPFVDRIFNIAALRPYIARRTEATLRKSARREHYPAPYAILTLWERHGATGAAAYEAEARSISELMCSPTSRNLVRIFLLQDRLKGLGSESSAQFNRLHVIGAGVMGGDIAAWGALRGLEVTLQDRSEELVRPALTRAQGLFDKRVKDEAERTQVSARLKMDVAGDGVAEADVVLEAIFENAEAKRALYASLEPKMKPGAILATNTSSIMLETLSAGLKDPSRLVGVHFFNPVPQLPLVEIVHGAQTQQLLVSAAEKFARRLDKLPLPCRSAPGFVVNRILTPYVNEAFFALESGLAAEVIDRAAVRFGMPMGPIELTDVVGLDVSLNVGRVLAQAFNRPVPTVLIQRVDAKKLGRKSGEGFYRWVDGKAQKLPARDEDIPEDLEDRLFLPMLNEAVACLRAGIIQDADLLDAGCVFATGFAPFRGGPLRYAKERGIEAITAALTALERLYGERFRPDPGWQQLSL